MNYNLHCNLKRVPGMWHVEDVGDVILIFFECNAIYVKDVKDRSNIPKGCNAMYGQGCHRWEKNIQIHFYHTFLNMVLFECNAIYVEDVEDRSNTPDGCNAMYVEDVEDVKDRSNTPKGCNAMYVRDVEDGKRTYTHILVHNFLNI